jgi:hypothetical protein
LAKENAKIKSNLMKSVLTSYVIFSFLKNEKSPMLIKTSGQGGCERGETNFLPDDL